MTVFTTSMGYTQKDEKMLPAAPDNASANDSDMLLGFDLSNLSGEALGLFDYMLDKCVQVLVDVQLFLSCRG